MTETCENSFEGSVHLLSMQYLLFADQNTEISVMLDLAILHTP